MVEKKKRKNKPGAGRIPIPVSIKKGYAGLTNEQIKQVKGIADERNVSMNTVIRQAVEWYLNAIELGRNKNDSKEVKVEYADLG